MANAHDLLMAQRAAMTGGGWVPQGFKEIEYLEITNGDSYIKTGVVGHSPIRARSNMRIFTFSNDVGYFGTRRDSGDTRLFIFHIYPSVWDIGYSTNTSTGVSPIIGRFFEIDSEYRKGLQTIKIDGDEIGRSLVNIDIETLRELCFPMYVDAYGNPSVDSSKHIMVKDLEIWMDDVKIRDFKCLKRVYDGVGCMFDRIEKKVYYNQGGTEFGVGPEIG